MNPRLMAVSLVLLCLIGIPTVQAEQVTLLRGVLSGANPGNASWSGPDSSIIVHLDVRGLASPLFVDDDAVNDPGPHDPHVSDPLEDGSSEHPFDSIQEAIDAASDGMTISVLPGTYGERIEFLGKAVNLASTDGPDVTTISGEQSGTVVSFLAGEMKTSVLDGFTLVDGEADVGGGIHCNGASPTIINNIITGNSVILAGGGIFCENNSSPKIENNIIVGNQALASDSFGAGVFVDNSSPSILGNAIMENSANGGAGIACQNNSSPIIAMNDVAENEAFAGGGILCGPGSSPIIIDNSISANTATFGGGGILVFMAEPELVGNEFEGNSASLGAGGGLLCLESAGFVDGNSFTGNTAIHGGAAAFIATLGAVFSGNHVFGNSADSLGGGIYCQIASPLIHDNSITQNTAGIGGGGITCSAASPTVTSNTINQNTAPNGGGLYVFDESAPMVSSNLLSGNLATSEFSENGGGAIEVSLGGAAVISNCTISGNVATSAGGGILCSADASAVVTNTIVTGNEALDGAQILDPGSVVAVRFSIVEGGWPGEQNFDADPEFVDAGNGDYHLTSDSAAINAGDPEFQPRAGETDLDGHFRVLCDRVDVGAYEFGVGDWDCDGDVDLFDLAGWFDCFTGPDAAPFPANCEAFDSNADLDIDFADFAVFQTAFTGGGD